jgi:hypothetical protein
MIFHTSVEGDRNVKLMMESHCDGILQFKIFPPSS